eukprot:COSAG02_NODE_26646_length_628_cov_0.996219_1_plen_145_part_01
MFYSSLSFLFLCSDASSFRLGFLFLCSDAEEEEAEAEAVCIAAEEKEAEAEAGRIAADEGSAVSSADGSLDEHATAMEITCPDGSRPGDLILIEGPDGEDIEVVVPDGVGPGETFEYLEAGTAHTGYLGGFLGCEVSCIGARHRP